METVQRLNANLTKKTIYKANFNLTKQANNLLGSAFKIDSTNSVPNLKCIPCNYYLFCFRKKKNDIKVLINLGNEINAMHLAYAMKIGLPI